MAFCINEYFYAGMDFHGDPDLPLLVDAQWGDICMISFLFLSCVFFFFCIYIMFLDVPIYLTCVFLLEQMLDQCA